MNKFKNILAGIFTISLFVGCTNSGNVTFLMPEKRDTLLTSCQTIVKGTITDEAHKADLTVGEQLDVGGMPSKPKNGYKHDFTINVESVIKGNFSGQVLHLHDLKDPNYPGMAAPQLWLGPGQKVYVGWQNETGGNYVGLTLVNAEKVPTTSE